jgi:RNA polymerase sigma factor (sigma-70 family)
MPAPVALDDLLRELAPKTIGALVRRFGDFAACEDAAQEALIAAAAQWRAEGIPANPQGWLMTVASRRRIELYRNDMARRRREERAMMLDHGGHEYEPAADADGITPELDDSLTLLFLCCHPSLTAPSQVALTLRAVGGLSTAEIARGFLVPEATIAQRISRAKQRIKSSGARFVPPPDAERPDRMRAVLRVLYLVFTEGHTASAGAALYRRDLTTEAIRLTRLLYAQADDGEVAGLLALMLLTDARRAARTTTDGALVPLAEQDRGLWDAQAISEGVALITDALKRTAIGPYQLQAAIAAIHAEARRAEDTDWRQILALYELLEHVEPGPMVTLNRLVALAMVAGPRAALDRLKAVEDDPALAAHHRVDAVRAHLLEAAGDLAAARIHYLRAAQRTLSVPEQRYLSARAAGIQPA